MMRWAAFRRDFCGLRESFGMRCQGVGAVLLCPVCGCPGVFVQVADAGVVCGDPVVGGERGGEDGVHVAVDGHVGVEVADEVVFCQLEVAEFCPGVVLDLTQHSLRCGDQSRALWRAYHVSPNLSAINVTLTFSRGTSASVFFRIKFNFLLSCCNAATLSAVRASV
jgi:hypothetical protein